MKIEKIILGFVAITAGLFVAGIAFYIYETTQSLSPSTIKTVTLQKPSPTSGPSVPLAIDSPQDESVTTNRIITVSGRTDPTATIIVTTDATDMVVNPSGSGAFSLNLTIDSGENRLFITAVLPNGTETQKILTISSTTEDF